jgi:hypothetical protein
LAESASGIPLSLTSPEYAFRVAGVRLPVENAG